MEQEEWKEIPDHPGYLISSKGNLKSKKGILLSPYTHTAKGGKKYKRINLCGAGKKRKKHSIHRLMCLAFFGKPPQENMEAAHKDDDGLNNNLDNLAWMTKSDNMKLLYKNKRHYETQLCSNCPAGTHTEYDHDEHGTCQVYGCMCIGFKRKKK